MIRPDPYPNTAPKPSHLCPRQKGDQKSWNLIHWQGGWSKMTPFHSLLSNPPPPPEIHGTRKAKKPPRFFVVAGIGLPSISLHVTSFWCDLDREARCSGATNGLLAKFTPFLLILNNFLLTQRWMTEWLFFYMRIF